VKAGVVARTGDVGRAAPARNERKKFRPLVGVAIVLIVLTALIFLGPYLSIVSIGIWMYRKSKMDEYYNNFPKTKERIDALSDISCCAFMHGAKAGKSIVAQFDSNIPGTPAYEDWRSYYAGMKARDDDNNALIEAVETSRFHLD
jgi:hypothetical protein